jgi:hypothetical protein
VAEVGLTCAEGIKALKGGKRRRGNKFGAIPTQRDGIWFASGLEADGYSELKLREKAGEITDLELQVKYELTVNDVWVKTYTADYRYRLVADGTIVVSDAKGYKPREWGVIKRLMKACYGIDVKIWNRKSR